MTMYEASQLTTQVGDADAEGHLQREVGWLCPSCNMRRGEDGHDPCIRGLSGVKYACCGHGKFGNCPGYVAFESGQVLRFHYAAIDGTHQEIMDTDVSHYRRSRPSTSFPYLAVSRVFRVPYGRVLLIADALDKIEDDLQLTKAEYDVLVAVREDEESSVALYRAVRDVRASEMSRRAVF